MIGSIAKIVQSRHTVMGSGIMTADPRLCKDARWLWCRGPRTRQAVLANGGACPMIYGDPALLLPKFVAPTEKKYSIGITPHYIDYQQVKNQYAQYKVINLLDKNPLTIVSEITQCEKIISSSLHGIITAHAYGIPAAWVKFDGKLAGDDTKFHDHYEAFNSTAQLSTIDHPIFSKIDYDMSVPHDILKEGKILS
jgi:pyruvyltransferase